MTASRKVATDRLLLYSNHQIASRACPRAAGSGPAELDAEIAAAARAAGMSYGAWVAQAARREFTIRAGLEAVSQYEAEHRPLTPDEIAAAGEWAARVTRTPGTRRTA